MVMMKGGVEMGCGAQGDQTNGVALNAARGDVHARSPSGLCTDRSDFGWLNQQCLQPYGSELPPSVLPSVRRRIQAPSMPPTRQKDARLYDSDPVERIASVSRCLICRS